MTKNIFLILLMIFSLCLCVNAQKRNVKTKPKAKKVITQTKTFPYITSCVINGKPIILVKPEYPPVAKAVNAKGDVQVQVKIDEKGNVVEAKAISGHIFLHQASEKAALSSKFEPVTLSNNPVKVSGIIVYRFIP